MHLKMSSENWWAILARPQCVNNRNTEGTIIPLGFDTLKTTYHTINKSLMKQPLNIRSYTNYKNILELHETTTLKQKAAKHVYIQQTSIIKRILVSNNIFVHSDVVGASPVDAAPTTSQFLT